jgi:hypothetical protein
MAGRQRTTFAKLQRERARQEKQAAKRARRQGLAVEPEPTEQRDAGDFFGPNGEIPDWLQEASSPSSSSSSSAAPDTSSEPEPEPEAATTATPQQGSDS